MLATYERPQATIAEWQFRQELEGQKAAVLNSSKFRNLLQGKSPEFIAAFVEELANRYGLDCQVQQNLSHLAGEF